MTAINRAWVITLVAIITLSGGQLFAADKPEEVAQKSADEWLAIIDAGKYAESWTAAAAYFKNAITQEKWVSALDATRKPLGSLISRKLKSAEHTTTLPGAPDGDYVVLQFETSFENKKTAIETVTPMLDKDGQWRVSGYFIK